MVAEKPPEHGRSRFPRRRMKRAVAAYAQSEKVKSGLIWICQVAEQVAAMEGPGRQQGVSVVDRPLPAWLPASRNWPEGSPATGRWHEIGENINMALVMIRSGVPQETGFHLTRAISRVTRIGG